MNKLLKVSAVLAILFSAVSCSKEGCQLFRGNYSFKTSGSLDVHVTGTYTNLLDETTDIDEQLSVTLATEQGQMDVMTTSAKEGMMVITMNVLAGDVYVADAEADGSKLSLEPFDRKVNVMVRDNVIQVPVSVSGMAGRYEDTVIYELQYEGSADYSGNSLDIHLEITSSDVCCVAKLNK